MALKDAAALLVGIALVANTMTFAQTSITGLACTVLLLLLWHRIAA